MYVHVQERTLSVLFCQSLPFSLETRLLTELELGWLTSKHLHSPGSAPHSVRGGGGFQVLTGPHPHFTSLHRIMLAH